MPWNRSRPRSDDYDWNHIKARRQWAARHDPTDPCVRCGRPLGPMGRWLHLDHSADRTYYLGFAHATCNRSAGGREGRRRQNPMPRSRHW